MVRKNFKEKVPESTHWYFTIIVTKLFYILKQNSYSNSTILDAFFEQNNDSHQVASGRNKKASTYSAIVDPCVRIDRRF